MDGGGYAITIRQPFASAIIAGLLWYELREWSAPSEHWQRRLFIHAGRREPAAAQFANLVEQMHRLRMLAHLSPEQLGQLRALGGAAALLPRGQVIGTAKLLCPVRGLDKLRRRLGWAGALYAWPLRFPEVIEAPIATSGAPGIWWWTGAGAEGAQ